MEQKVKDKFKDIISLMNKKVKNLPETNFKMKVLFKYFLKVNTNQKIKYLIDILDKMNYNGEELIYDIDYEKLYFKFFEIAESVFKDQTKEIKMIINSDDLKELSEEKRKIIFIYLQFSRLIENSIKIFFAFLNYENNEILLTSKFTYLNWETIDSPEGLLKSFKQQILSKELKTNEQESEIKLIGFDDLEKKYLNFQKSSINNIISKDFYLYIDSKKLDSKAQN